MKITNIEVDARGRATLGKNATQGTYRMSVLDDGTLMLEPTYTKAELALRSNKFALEETLASLRGEDMISATRARQEA